MPNDPLEDLFSALQAGRPMLPMAGPGEKIGEPGPLPVTEHDLVAVLHKRRNDSGYAGQRWVDEAWTEVTVPGFSKIPLDDMRKRINMVIKAARPLGIGTYPDFLFAFRFNCDKRNAPVTVELKSPFTAG